MMQIFNMTLISSPYWALISPENQARVPRFAAVYASHTCTVLIGREYTMLVPKSEQQASGKRLT